MTKTDIIPCTKEEMDKILEVSIGDDFYYMTFLTAKTTGRRLGELYGSQLKEEVGRKVVGKKIEHDLQGNEIALAKTRAVYKRLKGQWEGGVKVKDIDFERGMMKIWVLKRRKLIQDETVLPLETMKTIKHYIVRNNLRPDTYLFRAKSYRSIQEAIKRYTKIAEIPHKVSFHNFRHYFITHLKRKGWADDKITKLTGHKSTQSLRSYDHVVAMDIKDDALEDLRDI